MPRERLGSRLGFILLSAGCAIGIGNVWKFPYMVGQYGGGAFVLIYLFFLVVLGVPVLTMEFSIGRASQKSPIKLYQQLEPKGSKWHWHGIVAFIGNYILLMFYTSVAGWLLQYFIDILRGKFVDKNTKEIQLFYERMLEQPIQLLFFVGLVIAIAMVVCSVGLQNGLERITKWMMVALLGIMIVLACNSIFMKGSSEGIKFYLLPDFFRMKQIGIGNIIVGAMNQAFFTLSLGMGSMAIFGSYIGKERTLLGEAIHVAMLDTFVAVASGLIIFPACMAYGVQVDSGKSLIFITLPNIFNHIPFGRVWGSLFFLFMSFAGLSTVLAVFENLVSCTIELFGWGRKKTSFINGIFLFCLSIPCVLGFNVWKFVEPMGIGSNIMDLEDFIVSSFILPLGSLTFVLFCTTRYGWGWENFVKEANEGKGWKIAQWMRGYMTFVLPIILVIIFFMGIVK